MVSVDGRLQRRRRMLQLSGSYRWERANLISERPENGEVLVTKRGEVEEVDEPAFGKSMDSIMEQSKYVCAAPAHLKCLPELSVGRQTSEEARF